MNRMQHDTISFDGIFSLCCIYISCCIYIMHEIQHINFDFFSSNLKDSIVKFHNLSIADRVARERGWDLGTIVGYQVYIKQLILVKDVILIKSLQIY